MPLNYPRRRLSSWRFPDSVVIIVTYAMTAIVYFRNVAPALAWGHTAKFVAMALVVTLAANEGFGIYSRKRRLPIGARGGRVVGAAAVIALAWMMLPLFGSASRLALPLQFILIALLFATVAMLGLRMASDRLALVRIGVRNSLFSASSGS
jgi:hypothetical protein